MLGRECTHATGSLWRSKDNLVLAFHFVEMVSLVSAAVLLTPGELAGEVQARSAGIIDLAFYLDPGD